MLRSPARARIDPAGKKRISTSLSRPVICPPAEEWIEDAVMLDLRDRFLDACMDLLTVLEPSLHKLYVEPRYPVEPGGILQ